MSVLVKLTGYNLFGGTEIMYVGSRLIAESGMSELEYFNTHSEYYAVRVESEVVERW